MATSTEARTSQFKDLIARLVNVRTWLAQAPPWLVSLGIHAVALGALAGVSATIPTNKPPVIVETRLDAEEIVQPDTSLSLHLLNTDGPSTDSISLTKAGTSVGQQLGSPSFNAGSAVGISFGSGSGTVGPLASLDMSRRGPGLAGPGGVGLPAGVKIDTRVSVRGGSDVSAGAGGVGGAIDRITHEIARSLDERKTLVIWLLDVTGSLKPQHEELFKRVDRVYEELGLLNKDKQRALLTAVVAFGDKDTPMMAEPTDDVAAIKKAIRSMKDDDSGTENIFTAVSNALNRWGKYRTTDKRNIMLVVVTDEKGDDDLKVEETIALAKTKYQAKVYTIGAFAPLGRSQVMLPWPSASKVLGYAPADRGPESARIERDFLPFWSGGRMDDISSGFGPYALSRLCRETGGVYFIMEDNAKDKFDAATLRAYQPDYVPRKEYDRLITTSPIRKAIISAADMTSKGPQQIPAIPLDFPGDDAGLNRAMGDGQTVMAKIEYFVRDPLATMLAVEKDRDKESSRRWRAEYDLMLGRLLANKVRTYTYNAMCAQMKKKKKEFEKPNSNAWALRPDSNVPADTQAGPKLVEAAEKARELLNRVIEENPGTPWAEFAKREMQTDLGFRWQEFTRPAPMNTAMAKATPKPKATTKPNPAPPATPPPAIPKKI